MYQYNEKRTLTIVKERTRIKREKRVEQNRMEIDRARADRARVIDMT